MHPACIIQMSAKQRAYVCITWGQGAVKAEAHPVKLATGVAPFFEDHSLDVYKIFGGCLSENELLFLDTGRDSDGNRGLCRSTTQSRQHRVEIRGTKLSRCAQVLVAVQQRCDRYLVGSTRMLVT
jgi:cell fate regulator YaaT (PSP1 superfamily)